MDRLLGITVAVVAVSILAIPLLSGLARQRDLRRLRRTRDPASSLAACVSRFATASPSEVERAYKSVQGLVPLSAVPLLPDDSLLGTLRIDQGELENKLAELGMAIPVDTVEQLVSAMLKEGPNAT